MIYAPRIGLLFLAFLSFLTVLPEMRSETGGSSAAGAGGGETGTGTFSGPPFLVSVSVRGGYDDNVSTSNSNRQESWFTNTGISASYSFGSPRTRFDLQAGASVTYYLKSIAGQDDFDPNLNINFSITHKATARLTLSAVVYATYQQEPDFSVGIGLNRRTGNYFYSSDKFTATYLWTPRFSTATSYTLGAIHYDDSSVGSYADRIENTFGNEFRFLLWPTTTVVAEYRFELVSYDDINRDSTTNFVLVGFDHNFSPRLSASFRGGAEFRSFDAGGDESSPYFEGTLNYAVGKDTSLSWTNHYGIEEPDVPLNPSRTTFRAGLSLKHNFTARISGTFSAYYTHDDYEAITTYPFFFFPVVTPAFSEDSFDLAISVRYAITRYFALEAGYNHSEVTSDEVLREYSRNRIFAGLNLTF
jgi:Putative beta-barrel porin 2